MACMSFGTFSWRELSSATVAHRPSCPRIIQRLLVVDITVLLVHDQLFVPACHSVQNVDERLHANQS